MFFQFLWFQITLRRSSVILKSPKTSEISTDHIWVLCINSWKNDVWSSPIIYGNFSSFWCRQNTIFGQKIRKIWGYRNFWWSLKWFLEGPRIWNCFWRITWHSFCLILNITRIHHYFTKNSFLYFEEMENQKIIVFFTYKTTVLFFCCCFSNMCCFFWCGALFDP